MFTEEKQNFQTFQDSKDFLFPENEKEVSKIVKNCYNSDLPIEIIGIGSKKNIGKPLQCAKVMNLSKLNGIIEYLPEELYIKVKACTPMSLIEETVNKKNQQLAFEPIDFGYLFNGKSNYGSVAGHVSCNISGPRRFKSGSIRDHVLGFRAVNGKGEIIKSGGTVVKNVTGYDLSKIICGAYGTLVALTEITLKVLPLYKDNNTLVLHALNLEQSGELLNKSLSSSDDISGAVYLPNNLDDDSNMMNVNETFKFNDLKYEPSFTALRFEGSKISINERIENILKEFNLKSEKYSILETYQSDLFWKKIKNLELFSNTKNSLVRVVIPPSECIKFIYQLKNVKFKYYLDWGGSLIWLEIEDLSQKLFDSLKKKVVSLGGYLTIIKKSDDLRYIEEPFTIDRVKFNISQNIKKSFDPKKILNPGKMDTGI